MNIMNYILIIVIIILLMGCANLNIISPNENNHHYPLHQNITVTLFWVGEEASEENGYISNMQSAWDDKWLEHYGGVDDPNNRNGYLPASFIPSENPFYFALPYNDFNEEGNRKTDAYEVVYWSDEEDWGELESMCKNRWIKIIKGSNVAYAQWEDVGPFIENDKNYVFGDALPENELNNYAGLDISPAVRNFLNLSNMDIVDWQFVSFIEVPNGPWKEIITTSQVYWE